MEVAGARRRLFLSGEFNLRTGKTPDREFFYENHRRLKGNNPYEIIEDGVYKDTDESVQPVNYALPKNDFATAVLQRNPALMSIRFDAFRKVFDVLRQVIAESEIKQAANKQGNCQAV